MLRYCAFAVHSNIDILNGIVVIKRDGFFIPTTKPDNLNKADRGTKENLQLFCIVVKWNEAFSPPTTTTVIALNFKI